MVALDARDASFVAVAQASAPRAITGILGGIVGKVLILVFADAVTSIADAGPSGWVNLQAPFASTPGSTLTLVSDGAQWLEVSRSVN
jgi:hypothetical protein